MAISNPVEAKVKLSAVKEYLGGNGSLNKIAEKYGICRSTLQKWLLNYELFGEVGLQHRLQNHHYPESLKRQALESYLSGQLSIEAVCKKYQLRSRSQLESWIVMYNGQKGLRSPGGGQKGIRMTRKVTRNDMRNEKQQLSTASDTVKIIKRQRHTLAALTSRFTAGCEHIMQVGWRNCAVPIKSLKRNSLRS